MAGGGVVGPSLVGIVPEDVGAVQEVIEVHSSVDVPA